MNKIVIFILIIAIITCLSTTQAASVNYQSCIDKYPFAFACALYCQWGYHYDADGCFTCTCLQSPFGNLLNPLGK